MDKKENLRCALTGQPHDWVPASFFFHLKPHELEGEACTRFHVDFYRKTDVDFLKVMHDGLTAPCTLSPRGLWELKDYRPGRESNAYVSAYLDRVCRVSDALGGDAAVYANIFSPFTLLRRIGEERLLSRLRDRDISDTAVIRGGLLAEVSLALHLLHRPCDARKRDMQCAADIRHLHTRALQLQRFDRIQKMNV